MRPNVAGGCDRITAVSHRLPQSRQNEVMDHTYRVTELVGSSPDSTDQAIRNAVTRAGATRVGGWRAAAAAARRTSALTAVQSAGRAGPTRTAYNPSRNATARATTVAASAGPDPASRPRLPAACAVSSPFSRAQTHRC